MDVELTRKSFTPYAAKKGEEYMNAKQRSHFRKILEQLKAELSQEIDRTVHTMQDEATVFADPNDRASQESDMALELRNRDRERKLIKKIDETIARIDANEYGYCESCGVEIGLKRLEARPTATLCIDCKTLDELRERQVAKQRRLPALLRGFLRADCLHGQAHSSLVVGFQHLHLHHLAFLQVIGHGVDPLVADLRDVQQSVAPRQHLHDGAEVQQPQHRAFVDLADLDVRGQLLDALLRRLAALGGDAGDRHGAVVLDLDGGAGLLLNAADHDTALADDVADLVRVDLDLDDARRVGRELGARSLDRLLHDSQDLQPGLARLVERHLHDALVDRLDLQVHLQRRDAARGASHLEAPVAEVVLVAQDVGQHREAVAFLDQAHCDPRHVRLDRNAGIHQRQAAAADRGHR